MIQINGTAQAIDTTTPDGELGKAYGIEVFRCKAGMTVFVRTLQKGYGGLFTHYYQKRSIICPGADDCLKEAHTKCDRVYKGYCAAEFLDAQQKWIPICLEMTEHAELMMRHFYERGQIWKLVKGPETKFRKSKVFAYLDKQCDPATFPAPFDIQPTLRALYRQDVVNLSFKSHIADKIYVEASEGELPEEVTAREKPRELSEEERNFSFAKEAERRRKEKNGKKV